MIEIDTLLQTKTATKNIAFGAAYTYIAYIRARGGGGGGRPPPPPPPPGKNRIADYESRCLRKQD